MIHSKKNIGIISCKGGVGKSTISVNIATYLAFFLDKNVGIIDADIYGPNHPTILGIKNYSNLASEKIIKPKKRYNLRSISMGYFLNNNKSVLLRGPMISNTIKYMIKKTDWGKLDSVIIDFPPGTGDIYLSLLRDLRIDGAIVITTPSKVTLEDVEKSMVMLKKFDIKILGIIENMKYYECKCCGKINDFSNNSLQLDRIMNKFNISKKYTLPIKNEIIDSTNKGIPFIMNDIKSIESKSIIRVVEELIN